MAGWIGVGYNSRISTLYQALLGKELVGWLAGWCCLAVHMHISTNSSTSSEYEARLIMLSTAPKVRVDPHLRLIIISSLGYVATTRRGTHRFHHKPTTSQCPQNFLGVPILTRKRQCRRGFFHDARHHLNNVVQ